MKKLILLLLSFQCYLYNISLAQNPGDLDLTFNSTGLINTPNIFWFDIAIQPDGKAVVGGDVVVRYNVDGSLDANFGINGMVNLPVNGTCRVTSIQPDGKILVAGISDENMGQNDFVLIRYNSDGTPDSTFDGDGIVLTDFNSGLDDRAYELAIQTDGKIIVAGSSVGQLVLSRYHSDGSLDNAFDGDGKLVCNINVDNYNGGRPTYMKLQDNGKIVVGSTNILTRLSTDGGPDNSFGTNGIVTFSVWMNDLVIQPNGKITLAGINSNADFCVVRIDSNGNFDTNFGNSGITSTAGQEWACSLMPDQLATSVQLQPDGRILAGGYNMCCAMNDCRNFVLIRYNQNGNLDSSFGTDGQVVTLFPGFSGENESQASALTPDLKIVLAGHSSPLNSGEQGYLARYHLGDMLDVNAAPDNNENFVVSPNPTFDWINIEATKIEKGIWHFELRDVTGRSILQEDITATSGTIQKRLSLNSLSAGLYFIQLDNGKNKMVSRVVKYK